MLEQGKIDPSVLSDQELETHVRAFVSDAADCDPSEVSADANLFSELEVDSLGIVAVFIDVSYVFGVPEPQTEEEYKALDTTRKIVTHIRAHAANHNHE